MEERKREKCVLGGGAGALEKITVFIRVHLQSEHQKNSRVTSENQVF